MAQIDIDKFVISLRRCFGENKGIATTLDRCLFSLGLKYVDTPTGGRLERVDQPTMLEKIMWESGEQMPAMIKWKGDNLKEVIDLTGVYKEGFEKWFHNSWEEYEKYVHEHNNIFKIFNEDGSYMEVPVGAWIIKAPDGYNTASRFGFVPKSDEWSKEDERDFDVIRGIIYNSCNAEDASRLIDWLKALKDRVQPQPKQEWNEEDINMIDWLIRCCEKEHEELCNDKYGHQDIVSDLKRDCRKKWNWLESLKNRVAPQKQWKPSDEQLDSLYDVLNPCDGLSREVLESLYQDLKKLREE